MGKGKRLLAGLAVLAAGAAALPFAAGLQTQRLVEAGLADGALQASAPVTGRLTRYERGWLHAEAVTEWTSARDPDFLLTAHHRIDHGPLPGLQLATIRTTVRVEGNLRAQADYYFAGPLLEADTRLAPDGSWHTEFTSPPFERNALGSPDTLLSWSGATGRADLTPEGYLTLALDAPRGEIRDASSRLGFTGLHLTGAGPTDPERPWNETLSLGIDGIEGSGDGSSGRLENARLDYRLQDLGETIDEQIGLQVDTWKLAGGAEPFTLSDLHLQIELAQIHKETLRRFVEQVTAAGDAVQDQAQAAALVAALASRLGGELLRHSPTIRIREAGARFPEGPLSAQASLHFRGEDFRPEETSDVAEMARRLDLEATLSLPQALLRRLGTAATRDQALKLLVARGEPVTDEAVEALSRQLLDAMEQRLVEHDYLRPVADGYRAELSLKENHLTLNGRSYDEELKALLEGEMGQE